MPAALGLPYFPGRTRDGRIAAGRCVCPWRTSRCKPAPHLGPGGLFDGKTARPFFFFRGPVDRRYFMMQSTLHVETTGPVRRSPRSQAHPARDGGGAGPRSEGPPRPDRAALRAPPQPVLPQGPERVVRQARAHADAGVDEPRRDDSFPLAPALLGREPPPGSATARSRARGRWDHRAPDLRRARLRALALLPGAGEHRDSRRAARLVLPGGVRPARRRDRARGRGADLAPDPRGRRGRNAPAPLRGRLRHRLPRRPRAPPGPPAAAELPDDDEPHRDARLPQPVRVLLPLDRRAADALPDARPGADRRGVPGDVVPVQALEPD